MGSIKCITAVCLLLFSACFSSYKKDDGKNMTDGAVSETDTAITDYDKIRYSITGSQGNETVLDHNTQLVWQLGYQDDLNFNDALEYCSKLKLGGHDDWRLPSEADYRTIVDINAYESSPSFPNRANIWLWTSSESFSDEGYARFIRFDEGDIRLSAKENSFSVRCVRSGKQ